MLKKVAILAVGSLPVLLFLWYTYHFSSPFPNEDDIPAILAFVNRAFPFAPEAGRLLFKKILFSHDLRYKTKFQKMIGRIENDDFARQPLLGTAFMAFVPFGSTSPASSLIFFACPFRSFSGSIF